VSIPWNTARIADGAQVLTASVRDAGGHTGSTSVSLTLRNGAAATPLTAEFTTPAAGATVSGTVTVGLTASGGSGYSYRLTIDGTQVATSASYTWNTTSVANGNHTLAVTVTDSAGRTATSTRTVTVSNAAATPPPAGAAVKVVITQPKGGATVGGTAWIVLWVEGTSGTANAFTLRVGNTTIGSQTTSARGPVAMPWSTRSVANGTHTLTATVRDATGKTGSTTMSVRVQN
jgi:hypothetical protein